MKFLMNKFHQVALLALLLPVILFNYGCSGEDDPLTPQTSHFEPEGWVVRDATLKPLLVVWQGQILKSWQGNELNDTLNAPLNALSPHLSIRFLDNEQKIISAPENIDYKLGWIIRNNSMLEIIQDDPAEWAFHLKGLKEGKTGLVLQVLHIDHADVITPDIPVVIKEDTTAYGEPVGIKISYEESGEELANATTTNSTGALTISAGALSDHIKIEFYDERGKYFQPEYPLHTLEFTVENTAIAEIIPEANEPWVIKVSGKTAGSTNAIFKLMVGGEAEFVSAPVIIQVNQ